MSESNELKVRSPLFPRYSKVKALLPVLQGMPKASVTKLIQEIWEHTGTPQNPVDWSEPDNWIHERLNGDHAALAMKIWAETGKVVNPRHLYGPYLFLNLHGLLEPDSAGVYRLTDRGERFLAGSEPVLREIDDVEGLLYLLGLLATKTQAKRGDLLPEWSEFLQENSKFTTASVFKDTLRRRLLNLVERGYVHREGNSYTITEKGMKYAEAGLSETEDARRSVLRSVKKYNDKQREELRARLISMHPYKFEHLISDLLEAMGYEDVTVTKEAGDKGVDVVATVQFGITTITEVVQVKKHQGSIGRPVLDQLRGALPYHSAIRGTLITLGKISKGCREAALFPGAAPISLIDGDRLLDLLIEHEVGVKKRPVTIWELETETPAEADLEPLETLAN